MFFAFLNISHVIENKNTENDKICSIRDVLDENLTEEAILLRGHASGYELLPELKRYENTLVITEIENEFSFDEQSLKECHSPLTLITSVGDEIVDTFLNDMQQLGYQGELLY